MAWFAHGLMLMFMTILIGAVDELNLVPGVTAFCGEAGVLLVDSFCEERQSIDFLVELVEEVLGEK